jgi:hypothetical protein
VAAEYRSRQKAESSNSFNTERRCPRCAAKSQTAVTVVGGGKFRSKTARPGAGVRVHQNEYIYGGV